MWLLEILKCPKAIKQTLENKIYVVLRLLVVEKSFSTNSHSLMADNLVLRSCTFHSCERLNMNFKIVKKNVIWMLWLSISISEITWLKTIEILPSNNKGSFHLPGLE